MHGRLFARAGRGGKEKTQPVLRRRGGRTRNTYCLYPIRRFCGALLVRKGE